MREKISTTSFMCNSVAVLIFVMVVHVFAVDKTSAQETGAEGNEKQAQIPAEQIAQNKNIQPKANELEEKAASDDPSLDRKTAFRAVKGPQAETIEGKPLLFGAYVSFLLLIGFFLVRMGKINGANQASIRLLEQKIDSQNEEKKTENNHAAR